ncbi:MAG: 30S ribosomal protein S20 [candidate division WOR-3 bacterium]
MPIKKRSKSVLKNIRKSRRRYLENLKKKKNLKEAIKKIKKVASKEEALKIFPEIQSIIDKSVQDGIIKKNTAARYKARLAKFIKTKFK